jgi:putative ABC transport system permease protein
MWTGSVDVGDRVTVTSAGGTRNLTVVGVLNGSAPLTAFEGFGPTPRIYTSAAAVGEDRFLLVMLDVATARDVPAVRERALTYLDDDSDARSAIPANYAFRVQTAEEALGSVQSLLETMTAFVTAIALISLLVGTIGIANVMLVSVTERTREIGIMRALGAQRREILSLFLLEAVLLGLAGAVLGVIVGLGAGYAAVIWVGFESYVFPIEWAGIAVVVGILSGVFAGLYPAYNAARTDPIDALRYE